MDLTILTEDAFPTCPSTTRQHIASDLKTFSASFDQSPEINNGTLCCFGYTGSITATSTYLTFLSCIILAEFIFVDGAQELRSRKKVFGLRSSEADWATTAA